MQRTFTSRAPAGLAVGLAPKAAAAKRRDARPAQRLQRVAVAALDEPATEVEEAFDRDAAYAQFEALLDQSAVVIAVGDKVMGTVISVDQKGAYVDIGGKSTAFCPTAELSLRPVARASDVVAPGESREFAVADERRTNGDVTLSLRKLELEVAWARLRALFEEDAKVAAPVVGANRGGLLVEVEGVRGFLPGSQLAARVANFDELLGTSLEVKLVEVDEEKQRLMVSAKAAAAGAALAAFKVGDVAEGTVISVKPYGAFVDLGGGAAGLLHISQISHDRVAAVDRVLAPGDRLKVMVLSQDEDKGRVALCTKKLEPTPGDMLRDPALVYERAEEMAALFRERVAAAEAAAGAGAPQ